MRRASSVAIRVEIFRLALRRHSRVAQGEALMIPELLDIFGAPDPHQLQAFEVGAVGQQHVGDVIGFVPRQGEAGRVDGNFAIVSPTALVSQNEIAGLMR